MRPRALASPPGRAALRDPTIPAASGSRSRRSLLEKKGASAAVGEGGEERGGGDASPSTSASASPPPRRQKKRAADSTDAIASALTRRFGIAGGLAWLGVLTFGVLSEQIKTRLEESAAEKNTVAASGASAQARRVSGERGVTATVRDVKIGGGPRVQKGMLLLLNVRARVLSDDGESSPSYFVDTTAPGAKPLVFIYGTKLTGGLSPGAELALSGMRAGGKRVAVVPPESGFGGDGFTARATEHVPEKSGLVPPGATLEYELEVVRVSVPPS